MSATLRNKLLFVTRTIIAYVKELRPKVKSVTACILMQQLDFWFSKQVNGFYKFLEPSPNHQNYQEGDSWTEELGFSAEEFKTAFKQIGIAHNSKTDFEKAANKFLDPQTKEEKFYCSYYDRQLRLTYYFRNHKLVDSFLDSLVSSETDNPGFLETKVAKPRNRQSRFTETDNPGLQKPTIPVSPLIHDSSEITTEITTEITHISASHSQNVCDSKKINQSFSSEESKKQTETIKGNSSLQAVNNSRPVQKKQQPIISKEIDLTPVDPENLSVFQHWKEKCQIGGNWSIKREDEFDMVITARRRDGLTVEELFLAIDACAGSDYHMGRGRYSAEGPKNWLPVIFGKTSNVRKLIHSVSKPEKQEKTFTQLEQERKERNERLAAKMRAMKAGLTI